MIELAHPWFLLLLPLPWIVERLVPAFRQKAPSLQVPFFATLVSLSGEKPEEGAVVMQRLRIQRIMLVLNWIVIIVAIARPEIVGEPVIQEKSARDLMVAVDISGSMSTEDFNGQNEEPVSRLDGVKRVLTDFALERQGDRLGLIVFGRASYLQAPFTADLNVWLSLLRESDVGMAGQKTNFGDAIGLAIKLFDTSDTSNKVLLVLTDGNDTGSLVPPVDAAKIAASDNIRIYPIAIGRDSDNENERVDMDVMTKIATTTGGRVFRAETLDDLRQISIEIGKLEPELYETTAYSPRESLHVWLLGVMVGLYTLFHISLIIRSMRLKEVA